VYNQRKIRRFASRRKAGRKVERFTRSQNKLVLVFPYRIIVKSALCTWIPQVFQLLVVVSAEIHPERPGVTPRPEPEIARPEVEFSPVAGPSFDPAAVGTSYPSLCLLRLGRQ